MEGIREKKPNQERDDSVQAAAVAAEKAAAVSVERDAVMARTQNISSRLVLVEQERGDAFQASNRANDKPVEMPIARDAVCFSLESGSDALQTKFSRSSWIYGLHSSQVQRRRRMNLGRRFGIIRQSSVR